MKKAVIALTVLVSIFLLIFLIFIRPSKFWDGKSRFRMVTGSPEGKVNYLLFDPKRNELKVYPLSLDTEIEASYDLGSWKIGSLWKLGIQENRGGGKMLSQSLIRGYGLPVEGFLEYEGEVEAFNVARRLIFTRDTNLSLRDRLNLAWFTLHTKIADGSTLTTQSIIVTGEELNTITDGIVTISNTNSLTEAQSRAVNVLVSNLGGKVLDFSTLEDNPDQYCSVRGKSTFAQKLAHILQCEFTFDTTETTRVNLGNGFSKNF